MCDPIEPTEVGIPEEKFPSYLHRVDGKIQLVLSKSKSKDLCPVVRCRNPRPNYEKRKSICSKCWNRLWSARNSLRTIFTTLRRNALRRSKEFSITYPEFLDWLSLNPEYVKRRGRSSKSLQIDRIHANIGYVVGNLQVLTSKQNGFKGRYERPSDQTEIQVNAEDCPF